MAWTGYQMFLAGMLIITGSINTLATKWTDKSYAEGNPNGIQHDGNSTEKSHEFNHPFVQATGMFFGEFTCLIFFKIMYMIHKRRQTAEDKLPSMIQGSQTFNPLIFLAPAMCDMFGTSIMYIGLNLTYAASFQMFRGAVIIFTGLFSMIFLKRKLYAYKWIGILIVLCGLAVVGAADMLFPDKRKGTQEHHSGTDVLTGDLLIVLAQVIGAAQMVLEEKYVSQSGVAPLQAVGWEGLFGMSTLGLLLIPMYFIHIDGAPIEDTIDAVYQMGSNWEVAVSFGGTLLSISFFNFAGISVTKELNATTRMVLDSVRTIIIWGFSIAVWNQQFLPLTLLGFALLLTGMMLYNNILIMPFMVSRGWVKDPEEHCQDDHDRLDDDDC